ncbi:hypothetical protein B0H13DRAFT_1940938 [Mycena leptocephala]|nr:hypothetical protein B0H13DRAFT_1940938 [Mycena leptocephala]
MRLWAIAATILFIPGLHLLPQKALNAPGSSLSSASIPANVNITPISRNSTPSPGPVEEPTSGPNPTFISPPKRRGGQFKSIKTKRRRQALEEQNSWTPDRFNFDRKLETPFSARVWTTQ